MLPGDRFQSIDPATGALLVDLPCDADGRVERALASAAEGFRAWLAVTVEARAARLLVLADLLERAAPALARTAASEMGKVLAEGEAEVRKCAAGCRWAAVHGPRHLAAEARGDDLGEAGARAEVRFEPLGPVLALMPWNFPFWQVLRFAAPALLAGNTVLLKPAPSTPRCALALEGLFAEAGFPAGVLQVLLLSEAQAAAVLADARVRAVTLTGSTRAGRAVAALAGRHLKPCVLELGGSDPFVVLADADLEAAAAAGALARCQNAGQSCIAAKRFLVDAAVAGPFTEALVEALRRRRPGPPLQPGSDLGPLARRDLRDALAVQVDRSRAAGARLLLGGRVPPGPGWYYPPTLLAEAPPGAPVRGEETFGPVALVLTFRDGAEALRLANETPWGLGASLWTRDPARAAPLVAGLEAGSVFVNAITRSDPRLPFGGVKDSGWGRELGLEGLRAFTSPKTVWGA